MAEHTWCQESEHLSIQAGMWPIVVVRYYYAYYIKSGTKINLQVSFF